MSEKSEVKNSRTQAVPPTDNAAFDEVVWQQWLDKNKQRDAARRKKLIRLLGFIFISILICVVVWWLSVSK